MSSPRVCSRGASFLLCCVFFVLITLSVPAVAQSCALCYTQAAGSGSRMIRALKSGILILVVPPTLMTMATLCVCYRKRQQFHDPNLTQDGEGGW
jgi:hypothetical protein